MANPKVGDTKSWNSNTGTGYKWNGKGWVPYRNNKPVRKNRKGEGKATGIDIPNQLAKPFRLVHSGIKAVNKKSAEAKKRREKEGVGEYKDPKEKEKLKAKNEAVTNPKPKTDSKTKTESKSKTKDSAEKAAWIKKTSRSPAAKTGAFSDDERWALQQRHRAWKAARKKKKN